MRLMTVVMATLAGLLLLVGACAGAGPASKDTLDGTSWELVSYGLTKPIPGTTITATFKEGGLRGSAGCNSYVGWYQVSGDKIRVGDLALTEMACLEPAGVMEQELVFAEFIRDAQFFRLVDGQLQIFRPDGRALIFDPQE